MDIKPVFNHYKTVAYWYASCKMNIDMPWAKQLKKHFKKKKKKKKKRR